MQGLLPKSRIDISPTALIFPVMLLVLFPLKWAVGWMMAVVLHEAGHCAALRVSGVPVYSVRIKSGGMVMDTGSMSEIQELICASAGPVAGLTAVAFRRIFPELTICAVFHSLFNLLPILPLDGGRICRSLLCMLFSEKTVHIILLCVKAALLSAFLFMGIYLSIRERMGALPVLFAVILCVKCCKNSLQT